MANNLSLGIVIGATVSGTVARAFETLDQRAARLGRSLQQIRTAHVAGTRAGEDVANLIRQEERLAGAIMRTNTLRRNEARRSRLAGELMSTAGMAIGAAYAMTLPAKAAIGFETTMAEIRKVGDMTSEELKKMSKEIIKSSTVMPMSTEGIGSIVKSGLQAGIAKNEILAFKDSAIKMGIAYNIAGEEAGDTMVSWRAGMALTQQQVNNLADAINYLDANVQGTATAKGIAEVVRRGGAVAKSAGLSEIDTAALSAALLAPGTAQEVAATGMKNMLKALTEGGGGDPKKAQMAFFGGFDMTSEAVQKGMLKDAKGTILKVLEGINKVAPEKRMMTIGDVFGQESILAIAPMLTNLKNVKETFDMVADSTKYAGSMQKEYDIRSQTAENNAQLLSNKFDALKINVGSALLPTLNELFAEIGNIAMEFSSFAEKNPGVVISIVGLTTAFIGLKMAIVMGKYLATFVSDIWTLGKGLASGVLATGLKVIAVAQWLWNASLFGCPLLLIIGGMVALGLVVYKVYQNWEPIKAFFATVWNDLLSGVQGIGDAVSGFFSAMAANVRGIWETLINWISEKFAQIGAMANNLVTTAQTIGNAVKSAGNFMTTPMWGKGAAVGAAMAVGGAMPAAATPLPPLTTGKQPSSIMYNTNATIHVSQKAGEDSNDFADRVIKKLKTQEASDKRGRLHD
jgi:TP901 family phage tail tape measure protein